jgi:hypothetical protein
VREVGCSNVKLYFDVLLLVMRFIFFEAIETIQFTSNCTVQDVARQVLT